MAKTHSYKLGDTEFITWERGGDIHLEVYTNHDIVAELTLDYDQMMQLISKLSITAIDAFEAKGAQ
jgi:hypothetical protein